MINCITYCMLYLGEEILPLNLTFEGDEKLPMFHLEGNDLFLKCLLSNYEFGCIKIINDTEVQIFDKYTVPVSCPFWFLTFE